ncbi:MAG: hypothetical protein HY013_13210 [Candidatus Solibacter usitatus]|nr:hypothetical protein [Candidatus Solibacter usitatus]
MSDRGVLFLFSLVMIAASLAACGGLILTGQAATVDGLFLLLTCGLVALAFALYLWFMVGQAMTPSGTPKAAPAAKAAAKPAPAAAKPAAPSPATE